MLQENQPNKPVARRFIWSTPLGLHLPFTRSHTFSRASLFCLSNPIAAPTSGPDTQALFSTTAPPREHVRGYQSVKPASSCPVPDLVSVRRTWEGLLGRPRAGSPDWAWGCTRRRTLLASAVHLLIKLRTTCLKISEAKHFPPQTQPSLDLVLRQFFCLFFSRRDVWNKEYIGSPLLYCGDRLSAAVPGWPSRNDYNAGHYLI